MPPVLVAETPEPTRIELEHLNLHRHDDCWERIRGAVGSEDGWPFVLRAFAARIAT
jgi:hypothetical protein